MPPEVTHWYHLFAAGEWRDPVAEHLAALEAARYEGAFIVGVVGTAEQRQEALDELQAIRPPDRVIPAEAGWEQVTLDAAHRYADEHDGAVMYAHTKGAGRPSPFQDDWRRSMTRLVVNDWRANAALLEAGYDAVGCHWLTAEQFPGTVADTPFPMFGGNFWLATCEYLRRLPPLAYGTRHDAEAWVGLGDPHVMDLLPGWPGTPPFPRGRVRRLIAG